MMQTAWWLHDMLFTVLLWTLHAALLLGAGLLVFDCRSFLAATSAEFGPQHQHCRFLRLATAVAVISLCGLLLTPLLTTPAPIGMWSALLTLLVAGIGCLLHLLRRDPDSVILIALVALLAGAAAFMHLQAL